MVQVCLKQGRVPKVEAEGEKREQEAQGDRERRMQGVDRVEEGEEQEVGHDKVREGA